MTWGRAAQGGDSSFVQDLLKQCVEAFPTFDLVSAAPNKTPPIICNTCVIEALTWRMAKEGSD